MHTEAQESWNERNESGALPHGFFAQEMLGHDVYSVPEDDDLVLCAECGVLGRSVDVLAHERWCSCCRPSIRPMG